MSNSDSEMENLTPLDIVERATRATHNLLSVKSLKTYDKFYSNFMDWRNTKKVSNFSKNVLLVYFDELSKKVKFPTLWTHSILKFTLGIKRNMDISKYPKLHALLKYLKGVNLKKLKRLRPTKSSNLFSKVACMFGIMGACRRHELHKLEFRDLLF